MKQFFKHFFKLSTIPLPLFIFLFIHSTYLIAKDTGALVSPSTTQAAMPIDAKFIDQVSPESAHQATSSNPSSVHDMFKDVPQDELLNMMAEGQEFIRYLEEHGTEEDKAMFAQAMEETLKSFTEEDWLEFEAIVDAVQDKLPPLFDEPVAKEITPTPDKVNTTNVTPIVDNSLEKLLYSIHKAINAILLKAKGDKLLTERIAVMWENKDDFNEMVRLLQTLNKKEHLAKLTTSKEETDKLLLESIQNFNKRLQLENDQFIIDDTFGLQADDATTIENLKKLNTILDFFDRAIASLLPKLIKFMEAYEPLALKSAKDHDEEAKKALDHATKVEKQKRPTGQMPMYDRSPSNGSSKKSSSNTYPQAGNYEGASSSKEHPHSYLEDIHRNNISNASNLKKDAPKNGSGTADKSGTDKKEVKKSAYDNATGAIENYLDMYTNQDVGNYMTTVSKAQNIYQPFGKSIDEKSISKAQDLQTKRSAGSLNAEDEAFLQKHEEQYKIAFDNFTKNTQKAHSYYAELQDSIDKISPQIDEIISVIATIKSSLNEMNSKELDQLHASPMLKNFSARIYNYHDQFKNVQRELKNKHKLHQLEDIDSRTARDYDELENKIHSLHGLDRKIADARSQLESLHKAIKAALARRKRDENKAAAGH
ncbi:hypothetical protein KBC04_02630 [Candidatus Babeliales bacterium]|nr:hypothetical protein [Candidatus Babeliales bacterium]MBP9844052.1 hypothetical protein [Candidatus Babeliales bacterium]